MKKDIYAIYESYRHVNEEIDRLPNTGSPVRASGNDTSRHGYTNGIAGGAKPVAEYNPYTGNTEANEAVGKISSILNNLKKCADKADYGQMVLDCKKLTELVSRAHLSKTNNY
jgi:hypothetical protein